MSCKLNSLMWGNIIGVIEGDTRSFDCLDYSSLGDATPSKLTESRKTDLQ